MTQNLLKESQIFKSKDGWWDKSWRLGPRKRRKWVTVSISSKFKEKGFRSLPLPLSFLFKTGMFKVRYLHMKLSHFFLNSFTKIEFEWRMYWEVDMKLSWQRKNIFWTSIAVQSIGITWNSTTNSLTRVFPSYPAIKVMNVQNHGNKFAHLYQCLNLSIFPSRFRLLHETEGRKVFFLKWETGLRAHLY